MMLYINNKQNMQILAAYPLPEALEVLAKMRLAVNEAEKILLQSKYQNYELYLKVEKNYLWIQFNIADYPYPIGWIDKQGKCFFLDTPEKRTNWQNWYAEGAKCSLLSIKWKDVDYSIKYGVLKRMGLDEGCIYNFLLCYPSIRCKDSNISRYPNSTPTMYSESI